MPDSPVFFECRTLDHLLGRLIFLLARCSNANVDHGYLMRRCEAKLADAYGEALVLKVVRFSHACGPEMETVMGAELGPAPSMHYSQPPLDGGAALMIFAVAEAAPSTALTTPHRFAASGCAVAVAGQIAGTTWLGVSAHSEIAGDATHAYSSLFRDADAALAMCGSDYSSLVRTWTSYAGAGAPGQNTLVNEFQSFNQARKAFYAPRTAEQLLGSPYCANTGLRDWSSAASMAGVGVHASDRALRRIEIANPLQAPPATYASALSVAQPLFSRGYATDDGESTLVWVSGMVAVRGTSVDFMAPEQQIDTVVTNLEALLSTSNLAAHGIPEPRLRERSIPYAFVALLDVSHAPLVRERLQRSLGDEAMLLFTQASGFALPGLQVEIDCVAHYTNQGDT